MLNFGPLGLELLTHFEGFETEAYRCPAGVWTIGYGTTYIDGHPVTEGMTGTREDAERWLASDVRQFEATVRSATRLNLLQYEFDALVCFVYNIGAGAFVGSTIAKKLLNPTFTFGTADITEANFVAWNKATVNGVLTPLPGLTRRRKAEYHLFSTGTNQFQFD